MNKNFGIEVQTSIPFLLKLQNKKECPQVLEKRKFKERP